MHVLMAAHLSCACPTQRTRDRYGPLLELEPDDIEWLCSTCARQLALGRVPSGASKANNLALAPIPAELSALNPMEVRLISPVRRAGIGVAPHALLLVLRFIRVIGSTVSDACTCACNSTLASPHPPCPKPWPCLVHRCRSM